MNQQIQKAFKIFKPECLKQLERLGLQGWDVTIQCAVLQGEDAGDAANTVTQAQGRIAVITMNSDIVPQDPKRLAKHEVSHIFLEQLSYIAERRWASQVEWETAIESACTVLEKII